MIRKLLVLILIACSIASCSSSRHTSRASVNKKTKKLPKREASIRQKLETEYRKCKGVPYKYGSTTYKGFDCSGFVQSTYKKALKINLPRTTKQMIIKGNKVLKSKLKVGDLVFFKPTKKYRHVGIFMGNNMFIHASSSKGVMKSSLKNPYWMKYYLMSRRIF